MKSSNSPSIYQRFMRRDQAFIGKFSNGTTPKYEKGLAMPKNDPSNDSMSQ